MEPGKLKSEELRELVFNNIKFKSKDVILRPEIGEDCAAIGFGDYACVMSTDPITGAEKGAGKLAVHISCNDVASSGVKPIALLITILAPVSSTKEDIKRVMQEAGQAAAELGVEIIGGHTEITSAVNRMVLSTTAFGKVLRDNIVLTSGAKPGDDVIMTKSAGFEGTAIIASDREQELKERLVKEELDQAKSFGDRISVVKEGVLSAQYGVNCMHDVTEGGIYGAVWEIAESSGTGIELWKNSIPVHPVTNKICEIFKINPYKLISSGSMLITCKNGSGLVEFLSKNGVDAAVIGKVKEKDRYLIHEGYKVPLEAPEPDELFKLNVTESI